jgi:hypothetical protein
MKQLLIFISVFTILTSAKAQLVKDKFTVNGKCGMCKKNIEKAALGSGVKTASWDKEKQVLEVEYESTAVDISKVKKAIADAGYDNDAFAATEAVYSALPDCCKYRSDKAECSGKEKCKKGKKCCNKSDHTKACGTSSCDKSKACCSKKEGEKSEKDAASCCKKGEAGKTKKCCKE